MAGIGSKTVDTRAPSTVRAQHMILLRDKLRGACARTARSAAGLKRPGSGFVSSPERRKARAVGRSVFDREALGPAVKADATLLRLGRGRPRLSLRPVNDYGGNSGQREHRSSNAFHGGDLRTAPNVAQLFAESCNGHHKKSVSRTGMSIRPETSTHTPSTAAQIRVRGVAKRYGALQVFRGIEFNVGEREIVAIVGRPAAARQRCYAASMASSLWMRERS